MERYSLAEHVFLCRSGQQVVILDLRADRYWAVRASRTAGLAARVRGWPVSSAETAANEAGLSGYGVGYEDRGSASPSDVELPLEDTDAVIETLLARKILVKGELSGKDATPVRAVTPGHELVPDTMPYPEARIGSWATFARASAFARFSMRVFPFETLINRVRRRKARRSEAAVDMDRVRDLVEAYLRFRVFAFSSRNECLFDSLALLEFLAGYGIYPDWVFGVQTRPFAAHCWVQCEDAVCNDTIENVSGYTTIMVV